MELHEQPKCRAWSKTIYWDSHSYKRISDFEEGILVDQRFVQSLVNLIYFGS